MLVTCPECGNQVSDKAKDCPKCGCPIDEILAQFQLSVYDPETMTGRLQRMIVPLRSLRTFMENCWSQRMEEFGILAARLWPK